MTDYQLYKNAVESYIEKYNFAAHKKEIDFFNNCGSNIITKNYCVNAIRTGFENYCSFLKEYAWKSPEKFRNELASIYSRNCKDILRQLSPEANIEGTPIYKAMLVTYKNIQINVLIRNNLVQPLEAFAVIDRSYCYPFPKSMKLLKLNEEFLNLSDEIWLIPKEDSKERMLKREMACLR